MANKEIELWAYSIYGAKERKGLVKLAKNKEVIAQLSVKEARDYAASILQAAEAAETDEFMMSFLMDKNKIGLDEGRAVGVLQDFRDFREQKRNEQE